MSKTIIVGGGWAGLAAAIELTHHHIPVMLLDAANQLGGRARTIHYHGVAIDNGQHLILGAYHETLRLLKIIGVNEQDVFDRHTLKLQMRQSGHPHMQLALPRLPAPLHVIFGLAMIDGLSLFDRWCVLKMCASLIAAHQNPTIDIPVAEWLRHRAQSDNAINILWQPLCLAVLNTSINEASAKIFVKCLKDVFGSKRDDSDLLYARVNLGTILPEPARCYIEDQGGTVRLQRRATRLAIEDNKITGVELGNGEFIHADNVILAVPPLACLDLLSPHPIMQHITATLSRMEYAPICTVYLQYPLDVQLSLPMIGLIGTTGQWIFDRRHCGQTGLMAVVISSQGPHMQMDNAELCKHISDEVAGVFPAWPQPADSYVIRERRATFLCRSGIDTLRPVTSTPVSGCLLAGDYTATDYPATLEGAVLSGIKAAQYIVESGNN